MKQKPFTCRGCGAKKIPDGDPKNAAFIWTDVKTKTKRPYCFECDDKLIQDVQLPLEKRTREGK
jgi:hypothetical protein